MGFGIRQERYAVANVAAEARLGLSRKEDAALPGCFVYFIRERRPAGMVKIGSARSPTNRLRGLSTGSPVPLELMAVMPGFPADEAEIHRRFKANRERGEWFRLDAGLHAFIIQTRQAWPRWQSAFGIR